MSSNTRLIIQGQADSTLLEKFMQIAQPKFVHIASPTLCIYETIQCNPTELQALFQLADQAGLDANTIDSTRQLTDFKLLVMDMDSTFITIECIDEIADMHGIKSQVSAITESAMRGELNFSESLIRRVALLNGFDSSDLQRVYDERFKLSPGTLNLLNEARTVGMKTLLVSGGFTFFTERLHARYALDFCHANTLEIVDQKLTGNILGTIVDAHEKKYIVERTCAKLEISPNQTIVIGDGSNDLEMMSIAGLSVAYHAKQPVRNMANVRINHGMIDNVLQLFTHSH